LCPFEKAGHKDRLFIYGLVMSGLIKSSVKYIHQKGTQFMFRNLTELLLFAVLLLSTAFSCSGGASDDDGEPHFEPGDYDSARQDVAEDDIESDSYSALPDCAEVCSIAH